MIRGAKNICVTLHNVAVFFSWGHKIEGAKQKKLACVLHVSALLYCAWVGGHYSSSINEASVSSQGLAVQRTSTGSTMFLGLGLLPRVG